MEHSGSIIQNSSSSCVNMLPHAMSQAPQGTLDKPHQGHIAATLPSLPLPHTPPSGGRHRARCGETSSRDTTTRCPIEGARRRVARRSVRNRPVRPPRRARWQHPGRPSRPSPLRPPMASGSPSPSPSPPAQGTGSRLAGLPNNPATPCQPGFCFCDAMSHVVPARSPAASR